MTRQPDLSPLYAVLLCLLCACSLAPKSAGDTLGQDDPSAPGVDTDAAPDDEPPDPDDPVPSTPPPGASQIDGQNPPLPDWRDAVVYAVVTDRFHDGAEQDAVPGEEVSVASDWQGGDFAGLTAKIGDGYFSDLGINTLWISPFVRNDEDAWPALDGSELVRGYHGYWPTDGSQVEPHFGTHADLERMVAVAHSFGIRVVAEYVLDHVHINAALYDDHPDWFNPDPMGSNGCLCEDQGMKCSWDTTCWFLDYLPTFDFSSADARKHVIGQAVGLAESLRLDGYAIDSSQYVAPAWANDLDRRVESETTTTPSDFLLLAAGIEPDSEPDAAEGVDVRADWGFREVVAGTMLLRSSDLSMLEAALEEAEQDATNGLRPANLLGTIYHLRPIHLAQDPPLVEDPRDRGTGLAPQLVTVEDEAAYQRLANAFTVLMTAPGMPVLYYGDEIGMPGSGDPDNRHFMSFDGHTPAQRWLRERTRALIRIRNDHPALRHGTFQVLHVGAETIVYEARTEGDTVIVALNRSDTTQPAVGFPGGAWVDLLSGDVLTGQPELAPRSAMVATPSELDD